jgi:hypothetical protein
MNMKKVILNMLMLFAVTGVATAQTVTVADVEALPGETVKATLELTAPASTYTGIQFALQFPTTGFSIEEKTTEPGAEYCAVTGWSGSIEYGSMTAGKVKFAAASGSTFTSARLEVEFTVDNSLALDKYDVTVTDIIFEGGSHKDPVADVPFKVNVVERHTVVLDELATVVPTAVQNVDVTVKRTIKANEWSTICLPFAMTAEQITSAFGTGVQVKDFNGIESMTEGDDIVAIEVKFNDVNAIEANHPYVIKLTSKAITYEDGFIVEGVDIAPTGELSVDKDETKVKVGSKWYTFYNSFVGTYVAGTTVPENGLFLNGNQFWYSNGSTIMKGFRGYFSFMDVLSEVANASTRIGFNFDETTGIKEIHGSNKSVEGTYDLQGRKVEEPTNKGLYIVNGKKVVKK